MLDIFLTSRSHVIVIPTLLGNALERVQRVHEPADLWDITFCTRRFWPIKFQKILLYRVAELIFIYVVLTFIDRNEATLCPFKSFMIAGFQILL